jgi:hypothetical protein
MGFRREFSVVKRRDGNEILPYRKTGGWNIGRALSERDDVTLQAFERESEFTAEGRGVGFTYELWGTQWRRNCECRRKRKTKLL